MRKKRMPGLSVLLATLLAFAGCSSNSNSTAGTGVTLVAIAITPANPSVSVGMKQQFIATGIYSDYTTKDLSSSATWSSSDHAKATVDTAGLATALAAGTATITAQQGTVFNFTTLSISQQAAWTAAAGGARSSVALKADGTLWTWGGNTFGQLGNGTTVGSAVPTQIDTGNTWSKISAREYQVAGIKSDGTLWTWGFYNDGYGVRSEPAELDASTAWASVAVGYEHAVAIKTNGTLWAWGYSSYGAASTDVFAPTQIGTETKWAVAAASWHTVAIMSDGTLWAWGSNSRGELGDGTTTSTDSPKQIGPDANWAMAAAGDAHTVAIKTDGTLWAWGYNAYGQLGDGTNIDKNEPTLISSEAWASVAAGYWHTVALKKDGTLWAWGRNSAVDGFSAGGALGDGSTTDRNAPTQIGTDADWISVASGGWNTAAIKADGTLWTWGDNSYGQLGDGTTTGRTVPTNIP